MKILNSIPEALQILRKRKIASWLLKQRYTLPLTAPQLFFPCNMSKFLEGRFFFKKKKKNNTWLAAAILTKSKKAPVN